jgi:hypothetical protein
MKTIITAIDKAQREGVYTLEEVSIILRELDALGKIVEQHEKAEIGAKTEPAVKSRKANAEK